MSDITLMLDAINRGERQASEDLLPLVYDELRRLAAARMVAQGPDQTLQPTALVHEAWLRLVKGEDRSWNNRQHFFRTAALAMRDILVERSRKKLSLKRGAGGARVSLDDVELAAPVTDELVLLVDESLVQLEKEDPESAQLVTLKFFAGLTNQEVANVLGVNERTVERRWAYARASLFRIMKN